MKEILKEQYKNVILVLGYIFVACCVFVILFEKIWHNVLIDVFTAIGITAVGLGIGWYYISVEHENVVKTKTVVEEKKQEENSSEK